MRWSAPGMPRVRHQKGAAVVASGRCPVECERGGRIGGVAVADEREAVAPRDGLEGIVLVPVVRGRRGHDGAEEEERRRRLCGRLEDAPHEQFHGAANARVWVIVPALLLIRKNVVDRLVEDEQVGVGRLGRVEPRQRVHRRVPAAAEVAKAHLARRPRSPEALDEPRRKGARAHRGARRVGALGALGHAAAYDHHDERAGPRVARRQPLREKLQRTKDLRLLVIPAHGGAECPRTERVARRSTAQVRHRPQLRVLQRERPAPPVAARRLARNRGGAAQVDLGCRAALRPLHQVEAPRDELRPLLRFLRPRTAEEKQKARTYAKERAPRAHLRDFCGVLWCFFRTVRIGACESACGRVREEMISMSATSTLSATRACLLVAAD
mmetsp:Transcript_17545/g.60649  ORF Transcript_17545/g.60649 Transcript_17545/m.60649 type:complete len:383 (-) Transcript_17545:37-1185(-)